MISRRAQALVASPSALVSAHFACARDPYDAATNPNGYINFGTAENHLLFDLLAPKLNAQPALDARSTHYDWSFGSEAFRVAIAAFLRGLLRCGKIDPENIVTAAGTSAILDMAVHALCEPGDVVLIPAPYYSGFDYDLKARTQTEPVAIPTWSAQNFRLTIEQIRKTCALVRASGKRPRALLLSSPNNPLGDVYDASLTNDILRFGEAEGIDVIFDEIYAGSVFGNAAFTTVMNNPSPRAHFVWGFAKDFGLSGFKAGMIHAGNAELRDALRALSYFSPISTHTQALLRAMLEDASFCESLLEQNRARLRAAWDTTADALGRARIPFHVPHAGFFCWVDLSRYLASFDFASEMKLWQKIFDGARVSISPGQKFHSLEPGWFRLCFAHDERVLRTGIRRLAQALANDPERT